MAKTAILKVRIISDGSAAGKGFQSATKGLDGFERRVESASKVAAVAGGAVLALGAKSLSAASDLQQSAGAVDAVFKAQAAGVHELAASAATAVGLSSSAYGQIASVLGAQLKNLGTAESELAGTTNNLITLGADLSAQFGGTTQQAVEALSAAFRGERDPIERYGVSIKQTQVNAWLAARGLSGLEGQAKSNAEAQATYALIMEQTADAHGAFARETGTVAHQQQVAKASYDNAMASIGTGLLPVMTILAGEAAKVAQAAGSHPQVFAGVAVAVAGAAVAVLALNGAIKLYRGTMVAIAGLKAIWAGLQAAAFAYYTGTAAASSSSAAVQVGTWIGAHARILALWIAQRVAAVGTWIAVAAQAVASAAVTAGAWVAGNARAAASFLVTRGAMLAGAAATAVVTAAQWAWNAALSANPIGIVIIAIVALVALFVVLWNRCETFRNAVTAVGQAGVAAFNFVKGGVKAVIDHIQMLWNRTEGVRNVIVSAMRAALNPINAVKAAFDMVANAVSRVVGWIRNIRFPRPPSWMRFASSPTLTPVGMLTAASTANPSAFAVPAIDPGTVARSSGGEAMTVVNNSITVNGALDPQAVADQIRHLLDDTDRSRGSRMASLSRTVGGRV